MTELHLTDPCVVFALSREWSHFGREFPVQQRFPGAPCRAFFCGPAWLTVLVVESGLGAARMQRAAEWLLAGPKLGNVEYRPQLVLSAGYAGALGDGLEVGDLILATEVLTADGRAWPATWPGELPAGPWQPPLRRDRVLTVPSLVSAPAAKRSLGKQFQAAAVDMESATLAELCFRAGVHFGCLRVISDTVDSPLAPEIASLLAGGHVAPGRMLRAVLTRPGLLVDFWRLARDTRRASRQLGLALAELLTLTLPWAQ